MLVWLLLAILLYYVQVFAPAIFKFFAIGLSDYLGARAKDPELSGAPLRLDRALANMKENFVPFVALACTALALGAGDNEQVIFGAQIFVVSRALYVPLYAFAVPLIRSLAATAGWVGLVVMAMALIG